MERSDEIGDLVKSLCAARLQFGAIVKSKNASYDARGGRVSYNYADLADIHSAVHMALASNGLSIFATEVKQDSSLLVTGDLIHSSGQWIRAQVELQPDNWSPRSIGSATTYGRRYVTQMLLDISSDEDDDGEGAEPRGKASEPKAGKKRAPAGAPEQPAEPAQKEEAAPPTLSDMIDELSTAEDQGTVQRRYANMLKFLGKHKDAYPADAAEQLTKVRDGRLATLKEYAQ